MMHPIFTWVSGMFLIAAGIAITLVGTLCDQAVLIGLGPGLILSGCTAIGVPGITKAGVGDAN